MTMRIYGDRGGRGPRYYGRFGRRPDFDHPADGWTRIRVYPERGKDAFLELEVNEHGAWSLMRFVSRASGARTMPRGVQGKAARGVVSGGQRVSGGPLADLRMADTSHGVYGLADSGTGIPRRLRTLRGLRFRWLGGWGLLIFPLAGIVLLPAVSVALIVWGIVLLVRAARSSGQGGQRRSR